MHNVPTVSVEPRLTIGIYITEICDEIFSGIYVH